MNLGRMKLGGTGRVGQVKLVQVRPESGQGRTHKAGQVKLGQDQVKLGQVK